MFNYEYKSLENEVFYLKIDKKVRIILEKNVALKKPFDPIKTLDALTPDLILK